MRSMTGYGKGKQQSPYGNIIVEVKTLNHKSLNVTCLPFKDMFLIENRIAKEFKKKIFRGKVIVRLILDRKNSDRDIQKVDLDRKLSARYLKEIKKAQEDLGLEGELTVRDLLDLPGVLNISSAGGERKLWRHTNKAVKKAIDDLIQHREAEGERLARDFERRLKKIARRVEQITRYEKKSIEEYRKRTSNTIKKLAQNVELDRTLLEEEVASFAKNCDIAEEMTRLQAHVEAYRKTMEKEKKDAGKKLDFIAQEMQREANTIGAKASDFRISKAVIEVKSEIERMREQIKNIE